MNKKELQERYKEIETEELISIALATKEEFTEEAIQAAILELKERGVSLTDASTIAIAKGIKERKEQEETEIETTPLTKIQKIWFTLLPGISYWYIIFNKLGFKERVQRVKDANRCMYFGFALWLSVGLMIWLLMKSTQ